jgi:rhodanese-related sulfurtransferase
MDRLLEFAVNHYLLVGAFTGLLGALLFTESRKAGQSVSSLELTRLINTADALVLDIREAKEFREGHITGSLNIPYGKLVDRVSEIERHKERPVILVCKMGQHAAAAGRILTQKGFSKVLRLRGGILTWQGDGLPLIKQKGK